LTIVQLPDEQKRKFNSSDLSYQVKKENETKQNYNNNNNNNNNSTEQQ